MNLEHYENYASNGKGNLGVTLGAIGTGLGILGGGLNGLGIGGWNNPDNVPVNRYEASKDARIAALETEVKLRDANTFTMGEMGKLRDYVDHKFDRIERELCDQKVYNATCNATMSCIQAQVNQLAALTKVVVPIDSICPTPAVATTT